MPNNNIDGLCFMVFKYRLPEICNTTASIKDNIITEGNKVEIGGNEIYKSVCRKHFRKLTGLI